ncbi:glycoside hydrolase domain-containing protein [Ornithinibacillus scapharcae]|uniref:glycoside hydrolase domain-containing protein n=1 Tax=Ornithinibacillus scapharcae TaxID=1147159 RepID=UPI000225ADD0|nr:glycoside hydrolase domain-containing protein [Ornithinibacillus scapharcae]
MRRNELFTLVTLIIIVAIPVIMAIYFPSSIEIDEAKDPKTEEKENKDKEKDSKNNKGDKESNGDEIHWGVDSATYTDEEFFGCVVDNFGQPSVWGRYLGDKEGVSAGLDSTEVKLLHDNGIKILVIYNHVEDARGHDNGIAHAEEAIGMAKELEIPKGVAIFVDIEPEYPIDAAFLEGWYSTIKESDFEPGVYGVFSDDNDLLNQFSSMDKEALKNTIVWTAYPQEEITTKENAPEWSAAGPENAKVYGWQYAIDSETCNIDTNLFKGNIMEFLW